MSVHRRSRRLVTTAATMLCLAASAAFAYEPPVESLAQRATAADAVVVGVVEQVEYRLSRPTAEQPAIPYTFVTFVIENVIRGSVSGGRITLRFHGGLFPDGRFLDDSTAPLFDVGERSILLVSRNGDLDVPLAGWRFGRLRIIDGRVYDDFGKPLSIVDTSRVRFGRTRRFDEVDSHALGLTGRSFNPRRRELPRPGTGDIAGPGAMPSPRPAVVDNAASLVAVTAWIRALPSGAAARVAASVDPNAAFSGRSLRAVAPSR